MLLWLINILDQYHLLHQSANWLNRKIIDGFIHSLTACLIDVGQVSKCHTAVNAYTFWAGAHTRPTRGRRSRARLRRPLYRVHLLNHIPWSRFPRLLDWTMISLR